MAYLEKKKKKGKEAAEERQISGAEVEVRAKWRGMETWYVSFGVGAWHCFLS